MDITDETIEMPTVPTVDQWTAALRSGRFEQATDRLRVGDAYCCLGVLCEISGSGSWQSMSLIGPEGSRVEKYEFAHVSGTDDLVLPDWLHEGAGLRSSGGSIIDLDALYDLLSTLGVPEPTVDEIMLSSDVTLATLNDAGLTFQQIAAVIESGLPFEALGE